MGEHLEEILSGLLYIMRTFRNDTMISRTHVDHISGTLEGARSGVVYW